MSGNSLGMNDTGITQDATNFVHMSVENVHWQNIELADPPASDTEALHSIQGLEEAPGTTAEVHAKERRKVGRPIMYAGNTEDPGLTSAERRAIRRRIANRESARRVRVRRQELSDEMTTRVSTLEEANTKLQSDNVELRNEMMQLRRENMVFRAAQAEGFSQNIPGMPPNLRHASNLDVNSKFPYESEEPYSDMMQLEGGDQAIQDAQAERPPQPFAAKSVSMHHDSTLTDSVNFIGTSTAGLGLQSTALANIDDTFVPATFLKDFL